MTKYELLNILYAERSRVEKQYSQPGWTLWAIVAALAPISWKAWRLAEQCEQWRYVILVFNLFYWFSLIFELCVFSYYNGTKTPVWQKGDVKEIIQSVIGVVFGIWLACTQIWIIPHSFYVPLYWTALAITILFFIVMIFILREAIVGYLPNNNGWWNLLFALPIIPPIVLTVLYLCELGYEPLPLRLGVLLFAIFYLLTWLPVGQKKRFAKIDRLISRVVYDFENVDEIAVLRLLELQVIGIRYGRYLSEKRLERYYAAIDELITCANKLSESIKQGENEQINAIIDEGKDAYMRVSLMIITVSSGITYAYNRDSVDSSLLPLISANQIGEEATRFWHEIETIQQENPENFEERISKAYANTIGRKDIQRKINDIGLRDINRYKMFNEEGI